MEQHLLQKSCTHVSQAYGTPYTMPPLMDILTPDELPPFGDHIFVGLVAPSSFWYLSKSTGNSDSNWNYMLEFSILKITDPLFWTGKWNAKIWIDWIFLSVCSQY